MLVLAQPAWAQVAGGLVPRPGQLADQRMLYIAIGIVGATVMPHNLYLHSAIVQHRAYPRTEDGRRDAIRMASTDVVIALLFAFTINAAILILSSAVFHARGMHGVAEIQDAHRLMAPMLGTGIASFLFALALLASGQSSTVTATLAGQIVMEGFLDLKMKPWKRRLLTRSIAIVPALAVAAYAGDAGVAKLLVFSQVVLSMQLPFAVVPLVRYTSDRKQMGPFASKLWMTALASVVAVAIVGLNAGMLVQMVAG
jgi:manganese transport protein